VEELSEQEQWDQLKGWVRTNGPQVLVLVALMLLGWYGWKWWQGRGVAQAQAASAAYQGVLAKLDDNKMPEAIALIESMRSQYPKSPYVAAADLVAARAYVENNQLDKAAEVPQRVMNTATDEHLKPIARVRLARVQSAQGKYDAALATLGTVSLGEFEASRLEARGDILLAKGDHAGALAAYQAARKLTPSGADDDSSSTGSAAELLDLKISDLQGSAAAAAPASITKPAATP
jgi:predicted negative regulator of RcsB-dependent stress response